MSHHRCQHCGLINAESPAEARSWRCSHCNRTNRAALRIPTTLLEQVMQVGDGRQSTGYRRAA